MISFHDLFRTQWMNIDPSGIVGERWNVSAARNAVVALAFGHGCTVASETSDVGKVGAVSPDLFCFQPSQEPG
jgi:hypothetical protein